MDTGDNDNIQSCLRDLLRDRGFLISLMFFAEAVEAVANEPEFGGGVARDAWLAKAAQLRKVGG